MANSYPFGMFLGERLLGMIFLFALGYFVILDPAWFGLRYALGRVDPMAEAMKGVRDSLKELFVDIQALGQASAPDLFAKAALSTLEDLFSGRALEAAADTALLIARAGVTHEAFKTRWAPHLEAIETYPASRVIAVVHAFWTWLQAPEVAPVLRAAGRRFGLGQDVAEARRERLRELVQNHAPSLAHGFWYGLYATVVLQLLLLEALYAWGRPAALFWAACCLIAYNFIRACLGVRDLARLWPVRAEAAAIAAAVGISDLPGFALKLMAGQAMGVVTMLLLLVRFLALGEALHHPGNVLAGLHQALTWIGSFYLWLVGSLL